MKIKQALFIVISLFVMGGCATIVGEKTQNIPIKSTPDGAQIIITDEKGEVVFKGTTPTNVTLDKADGSYFGGKTYEVTISKDGVEKKTFKIDTEPNGWYVGGNLLFGGLIGWLVVDPLTGAMYNLKPDELRVNLENGEEDLPAESEIKESPDKDTKSESVTFMTLKDVPVPMHHQLKRIN